jgi:hypothetical protein
VQSGLDLVVVAEDELTTFIIDALAFEPVRVASCSDLDALAKPPALLIVEFDRAPPIDGLRALRDRGWTGSLLAIGNVETEVRHTLGVDVVLATKLTSYELKRAVRSMLAAAPRETLR